MPSLAPEAESEAGLFGNLTSAIHFAWYEITPCPKPRQTQQDRWAKRPRVLRYRQFADQCRAVIQQLPAHPFLIFCMPAPASWSKKKRHAQIGMPHLQRPDTDNFLKAFLDAIYPESDSEVWLCGAAKVWSNTGKIGVGSFLDLLESGRFEGRVEKD